MSYVRRAGLDLVDSVTEARLMANLTVRECVELCDISWSTWYRWLRKGAPRWAVHLILSQRGTLDRFGWKDWEIRGACLYFNQLHHRYHWTPVRLVLPLYNLTDPAVPWEAWADNLVSLDHARTKRKLLEPLESPRFTLLSASSE